MSAAQVFALMLTSVVIFSKGRGSLANSSLFSLSPAPCYPASEQSEPIVALPCSQNRTSDGGQPASRRVRHTHHLTILVPSPRLSLRSRGEIAPATGGSLKKLFPHRS
jgi:hypothetical protein